MAIRQTRLSSLKSLKSRRKRLNRRDNRGLKMEQLEDRRLLAGIQLAGISTNDNVLLSDGDVLNVAPNELKIRFSEEASLDPASLAAGIEIIRSGQDGSFESASVTTDHQHHRRGANEVHRRPSWRRRRGDRLGIYQERSGRWERRCHRHG